MESIRGYFKALKWRSLIVAFSAILLGLLFILTPQASADVICYVAGILLLASGIAAVVSYLASGRLFGSYALVSGIVLLVCGVFCLLRPEIIQGLLTVLFGVFLVIDGMMTLQDGVDCARARLAGWWVPALLGAVTPIFGKSDSFPQGVDPQQHAVKIAQFGPADIARQQTQPSLVIMDKRAAQQLLLARRQQGQDIPRRGRSQQVQMAIIKLVLSLLSPLHGANQKRFDFTD